MDNINTKACIPTTNNTPGLLSQMGFARANMVVQDPKTAPIQPVAPDMTSASINNHGESNSMDYEAAPATNNPVNQASEPMETETSDVIASNGNSDDVEDMDIGPAVDDNPKTAEKICITITIQCNVEFTYQH